MVRIAVELDDNASIERALDDLLDATLDPKVLRRRERFRVELGTKIRGKFRALTAPAIPCDLASGYDNTRTPSSGMVFFARATRTAKLRKKVATYVEQIIAHNAAGGPVFEDDETQLGEDAAEALAIADASAIPTFIAFLRSADLEHEVHQSDAICRIVDAHGWTADTIDLLAARVSDCAGQGGDYDLSYLVEQHPIPKKLHARLVDGVIEGCKAASVEHYWKYVRTKLVRVLGDNLPEPAAHAAVARESYKAALRSADDFTAGAIHSYHLGDHEAALACFTRFVTNVAPPRRIRRTLAEWARTCKALDREARVAFEVLVNSDDAARSAKSLCDQAYERYHADAYDDAIAIYDRAIATDPTCWDAHKWKAECLHKLEHHDGAITTLEHAIAGSGDEGLYFDLGCVYRDAGDLARALAAFTRNHQSGDARGRSGMADVHNLIGCAEYKAGALEAAAKAFAASAKCKATSHAFANLARVRFHERRHDLALEAARRSLKLGPTADVHNIVACIEIARSQFDAAKQTLALALSLDPKLMPARANLVCLHALAGDANTALDALDDALANGYSDFDWIATDTDLDSIRTLPRFAKIVAKYGSTARAPRQ